MKTGTQKTLDEMADSAVLAMVLDDMEFLSLIKWKSDADKEATIDGSVKHMASDRLAVA